MTPDEYLAAVDERRRPDLVALDELITSVAPDLPRVMAGRMIGYGPFRLPKASIGRSCVRFTRLADLDEAALRELVTEAVRVGPGDSAGPAGG